MWFPSASWFLADQRKLREQWSVRQTFKCFHEQEVELPVSKYVGGRPKVTWQLPTQSFLSNVLRLGSCAGAYLYGQRPTITRRVGDSRGRSACRPGK